MNNKVLEIAKNAYENVEFYNEIAEKNNLNLKEIRSLEEFPIIKKKKIVGCPDKLIVKGYKKEELEKLHTSGTTGLELFLYFSKLDSIHRAMILWGEREKNCPGIMTEKKAMFNDSSWLKDNATCIEGDMLYFNTKHLDIVAFEEYYKKLNEFQPKFIHTPPTVIYEFVRYMKKNNIKPVYEVMYIELAGEFVSDGVYSELCSFFEGAVIINYYGSVEFYSIAHGCKNNRLHETGESVYIEVVNKDKDGFGDLVITSLVNKTMPLIRYEIGDIGRILENKCSCGKSGRIIQLKSGRTYDYYIDGNRKITGDYFRKVLISYFAMNNDEKNIIQFSIKQLDKNELQYNLIVQVNIDIYEIEKYLVKHLNSYLRIPVKISVNTELNMLERSKVKFQMYDFWK